MGRLVKIAPWFFVFIWASGFVVAKYAFPNSDVIFFLSIRLFIAAAILAIATLATGASLKLSAIDFRASAVIGLALHGVYLGGVWHAIALGSSSGVASVITSMQPILVSLIGISLLGEPLRVKQFIGLFLGFAGVVMVVLPKMQSKEGISAAAIAFLLLGLSGSTSATLMQKKLGHSVPLLAGTTYQFLFAAVALLVISLATGRTSLHWNLESSLAMAWAVVVTSVIAILMLLWLLNKGSAASVTSLLYLVPPTTALQAYILFGEKVNTQGLIGIAMTALGVSLVIRK